MSIISNPLITPTFNILPTSKESIGIAFGQGAWGSAAWSSANRAVLIPFRLHQMVVVRQLFTMNGQTVGGNMDLGIYTYNEGRLLVHTGARAQAGTQRPQAFAVPAIEIPAGSYMLAMAMDATTGFVYRRSTSSLNITRSMGIQQMAAAFPLPELLTPTPATTAIIPMVGASTRSFL